MSHVNGTQAVNPSTFQAPFVPPPIVQTVESIELTRLSSARVGVKVEPWLAADVAHNPANERAIQPLRNQLYAHGAYMGLTRSFLQNPTWARMLRGLTPDTAARVDAILEKNAALEGDTLVTLMAALENHPVLAAYGTWRNGWERLLPIEWDIWLDAKTPGDLTKARIIHGNHAASQLATDGDPVAALLTQVSVQGTDVHLGVNPIDWRQAYERALGRVLLPEKARCSLPIYLDVKSSYSTSDDINVFIKAAEDALRVAVRGVGSFKLEQLPTLHVREKIHLFDTPEQVATAQVAGQLPKGAIVMFNGGFLLESQAGMKDDWRISAQQLQILSDAQRAGDLRYTIYIQETVASPSALDTLFRFLNTAPRSDNPQRRMFPMGLAYGNVNGRAESGVTGSGTTMQFAQNTTPTDPR